MTQVTRDGAVLLAIALWFTAGVIVLLMGEVLIGNALLAFAIVAGWVLMDGPDDLTERASRD